MQDLQGAMDALAAMTNLMGIPQTPETHQRMIMRNLGQDSFLKTRYASHIEVRPSKLHGHGVFVTRAIPRGGIISFYPAHAIQVGAAVMGDLGDARHAQFHAALPTLRQTHALTMQSDPIIRPIGDPSRFANLSFVAHMTNDAAGGVLIEHGSKRPDADESKQLCLAYSQRAFNDTNCAFKHDKGNTAACLVATREIKAGEEVLAHYGLPYWFETQFGIEDGAIYVKKFCDEDPDFRLALLCFTAGLLYQEQ